MRPRRHQPGLAPRRRSGIIGASGQTRPRHATLHRRPPPRRATRCARGSCHRTAAARGAGACSRLCMCGSCAAQSSKRILAAVHVRLLLLVGEGSTQSRCFHDLCTSNVRQDIQPEYHLPHRKRVVYKSSSSMLGIRIAFP
jgi:hypothetical protein